MITLQGVQTQDLQVCRHSVTMVASMRYPAQSLQVMCSFSSLIGTGSMMQRAANKERQQHKTGYILLFLLYRGGDSII